MHFITLVLLLSTTPAHAQGIYLNYSQWKQMPNALKEMYVAGAFDTLSTVTTQEHLTFRRHYNECVVKAGLSTRQLTENMQEYAESQPDLQAKAAPFALLRYLISLCGLPAEQ